MAQVTITQLPQAGALTGNESVPIVQNGVTVQTTTGAIASQPTQLQSFLTVNQETSLPNSRYLGVGTGLSLTNNGAGGTLQINMTGTAAALNSVGNGFVVKTGVDTLTPRSLQVGTGLSISNADGISANPLISLGSFLTSIQTLSGSTGLMVVNGGSVQATQIAGVSNQTVVTNADGTTGSPTIGLASNTVIPGTGSLTLPNGSTSQRLANAGAVRYNTDLQQFEGYTNTGWNQFSLTGGVTSFSAGTTGFTPSTTTTGAVVLSGVLNSANGGTGVNNGIYTITLGGSASTGGAFTTGGTFTTAGNFTTAGSFTTAGAYSLTLTSTAPTNITLPTTGTLATLAGAETLTNKTISGSNNTLTNIGNSSLTNSSVTIGTTSISLGSTSLTLAGLTSVTVTQDPTAALQLATKQYVDSVAQGLNTKAPVLCATTTNITLSGEQTIDGIATSSSRVLVKNQSTASQNGIYVSGSGAWTRSTDANTWNQLVSAYVWVEEGTINADTGWVCTVDPGGTLGVTAVTWVQFSGAGTYTAGTGLTLTGTQFSLTNPVAVNLGGTAIASYTTGDLLYASGSTTLSKLADIATGNVLLSGGVGVAPSYGKVGLTTHVTGTLPIANGGTNGTTAGIGLFNNITGYSASGATGTTSTNLVFSTSPVLTTPNIGVATATSLNIGTLTYTPANALISSQSSVSTYNQIILQNSNTGTTASADFIVNNSNSTDTTYYGDFGMNSSGFTGSGAFNQANNVYLTATTADLAIGTTTSNAIHFVVAGGATDAMTIPATGPIQAPVGIAGGAF